jgi:hypothetical protein
MIESMRFIKNLSASWIQVPLLKHSFVSLVCLAKNGLYGPSRFESNPKSHNVRKLRANLPQANYREHGDQPCCMFWKRFCANWMDIAIGATLSALSPCTFAVRSEGTG